MINCDMKVINFYQKLMKITKNKKFKKFKKTNKFYKVHFLILFKKTLIDPSTIINSQNIITVNLKAVLEKLLKMA